MQLKNNYGALSLGEEEAYDASAGSVFGGHRRGICAIIILYDLRDAWMNWEEEKIRIWLATKKSILIN